MNDTTTDAVDSQLSDVNVSNIINATVTNTGSPPGRVSATNPVIVRVAIFLIMAILNLGGNGFTLVTIRLTPRLWTKTNFILASMLAADMLTGVFVLGYAPFMIIVYVFNNPCHYNVAIAVVAAITKIGGYTSICHLNLISVERYIAIVYPLQYEDKFTDRTLKRALSACWAAGSLYAMLWLLWFINADLRKCDLIPAQYHISEMFLLYLPVCISMFISYGKILAISRRHHKRIEPIIVSPAPAASAQVTTSTTLPPSQSGMTDNTEDTKHSPQPATGPPAIPSAPNASSAVTSEDAVRQQRQKVKSRRREFKAVYLTAAIVGAFVILWIPSMVGRVLALVGFNPVVVNYLVLAASAIGTLNFSFSWVIYAAVSRKYRRAYRQMLIRIGCCGCENLELPADHSLI